MDFYKIRHRRTRNGVKEIYPDFTIGRSKDLMVRGGAFYAIWNPELKLWSTDEYVVSDIVDRELAKEAKKYDNEHVNVKWMHSFSTGSWSSYRNFVSKLSDNYHELDSKIVFSNTKVTKKDYCSKRVPYPLAKGSTSAYDELMSTLYSESERTKLEWAFGAVLTGDSRYIQKFIVLYGAPGTGKSTVLNILQHLTEGYYKTFDPTSLTSLNNAFATEVFKDNPLVAIQHEGDLSRVKDITKLNSIVSHDPILINIKHKSAFELRLNAFLFIATNKPVLMTDAKSGILRRLIDVSPSGNKLSKRRYEALMTQIKFELGAIAYKCIDVYSSMGSNAYGTYKPLDMLYRTNVMFNFVDQHQLIFSTDDWITLSRAWKLYKQYIEDSAIGSKLPRYKFRDEFKAYWNEYRSTARIDDKQYRSVFMGFKSDKLAEAKVPKKTHRRWIDLISDGRSVIDDLYANMPAQYASKKGLPKSKWTNVKTKLKDIDTDRTHYVKIPSNHIVIDFDIKDKDGEKSLDLNLAAAELFPPTYAEVSKSGKGLHLHYIYDGNVNELSRVYDVNVEVLYQVGDSALRRKLTKYNTLPIATINSGLPLKKKGGGKSMINFDGVKSERALRILLARNINKEIHSSTKSSIDFIWKILDDAHASGLKYDVTDMRRDILAFAMQSTNQADWCVKQVAKMRFSSNEAEGNPVDVGVNYDDERLVFFDIEVFPNLLLVCWKFEGPTQIVRMFNPSADDIEQLFRLKLVGFNNRRYDNHILYARYLGWSVSDIYELSKRIIVDHDRDSMFREAYSISYADVYDFTSKKQSLKKYELELGILHKELDIPWDVEVEQSQWDEIAEYCEADVRATEAVFEARHADFQARLILTELSGLTPNDRTASHTARIIFGNDRNAKKQFVYTDLSKQFPGYVYNNGISTYRGEEVGEGGYVFGKPGMYTDVLYLDIESMHPNSIIRLNLFGKYTSNYEELVKARLAIKHGDMTLASKLFGGRLKPYLDDVKGLSYALKIPINIVYGLTCTKWDSEFKDYRNVDNIVAKRGALYMVDLKHACQKLGLNVIHIKTDSIKIADVTVDDRERIIKFVTDHGRLYGYEFKLEAIFDRLFLANNAVLIAHGAPDSPDHANQWIPTGAQFAQPYVFKTLFSKEPITLSDVTLDKAVQTAMYLQHGSSEKKEDMLFIGKVGKFIPTKKGGTLLRIQDDKFHAVAGTKGWRFTPAHLVKSFDEVDERYFKGLVDEAVESIERYAALDVLIKGDQYV